MDLHALFARTASGIRPGLEVTAALLEAIGNPQRGLRCVHVAGTNGKGSVCAMIESVLRASGFKTGLYTSPHLFRLHERFRVNGRDIPDAALDGLVAKVLEAEQRLLLDGMARSATFFELSTVMAFEYFRREAVDVAVIETGMGGRWDSTNVIVPELSVITRIDVDHIEYLGREIRAIASEKAGIIKPGVPVVCGPMPVEAEAVIYHEAEAKNAPITGSGEAVFITVLEADPTGQLVDIEAPGVEYRHVRLPLAGGHQIENCGIAVAALEDLAGINGWQLKMKKGLESVRWPGRFELLQEKPPILYDGAHNPSGARALAATLAEVFPHVQTGFVFGFMQDKDVEGILRELKPSTDRAWALTLPVSRALCAEHIAEAGENEGLGIEPIATPDPALQWLAEGKNRLLCFTGSLYLADELRKAGWFR